MAETQFANQEEADEYAEAEAAQQSLSGYENTRTADVEDQREYRLIPAKTPCTLGIQGFTYYPAKGKAKAAIGVKVEVNEPEQYADGSSNFTVRYSLNPVVGKNEDGSDKKFSGWDMTVSQLSWLFAAANQVTAREGKAEMIDCVLAEFPNIEQDDVPDFHEALVANANEKLKGSTFKTKGIGLDRGQATGKKDDDGNDIRYADKQSFGTFDYPKSKK